jgi:hypothetical protein
MKRKEKEHLKQDPFVDFIEKAIAFLKEFHRNILFVALAVVAVVVVVLALIVWNNASLAKDNQLFGAALKIKNSAMTVQQKIDGLKSLRARRGASASIPLFLATLYYEKGDMAQARTALQTFRSSRIKWLNDEKRLLDADLLAASGQISPAVTALDALAADSERQMGVDQVLLHKAQLLLKADRKDEASATLKKILAEYPETLSALDARQKLASLEESAT